MHRLTLLIPILLLGCATSVQVPLAPAMVSDSVSPPPNDNLHATLWTQTAVEFRGLAEQAYLAATQRLDEALLDTTWTAALEQQPAYGSLPAAVVLDVDETVLDNSIYQARLILTGSEFDNDSWNDWVREQRATPVAGALAFTRYAAERGVRVIYLTNRDAEVEAATRANLKAVGFPVADDDDSVITQGERPEWRPSDKGPRRMHVTDSYRIVLLVGDNLRDFLSDGRADLAGRDALFSEHASRWGRSWIVLPNPQYGSWEAATFGHNYRLPSLERRTAKLGQLRSN